MPLRRGCRCRCWSGRPGRIALGRRGRPARADAEHQAASEAALNVLHAILAGYGITSDDAIHAIRSLRVVMHGFVTLEHAGGFGLPQSVDETSSRLIDGLDLVLSSSPAGETGRAGETA